MSVFGCKRCPDTYRDSVFLMKISAALSDLSGVELASAMMATDRNKDLFHGSNLWNDEVAAALPDDLVIAVRAQDQATLSAAMAKAEELLNAVAKREQTGDAKKAPSRIELAVKENDAYNICMISVAGDYAKLEAAKALSNGMNVMLYSDNISAADELALKTLAHSKGLIVMGPDCGTAIIGGVPFAFANEIRRGSVGIVGASGTGTQEVSTLIHRMGGGISHAFGTGGRDVKEEIGGITMMDCLELLKNDPETRVIVVVGKPPCDKVIEKIAGFIPTAGKPVVAAFTGATHCPSITLAGGIYGEDLQAAATLAVKAAGEIPTPLFATMGTPAPDFSKSYLRGLFCGGSLCYEALDTAIRSGLSPIYSNLHAEGALPLEDVLHSVKNTFLDMGEDIFTVGKPHPMIDPTQRNKRLETELSDPAVRVVLTDCVIGYGACEDPAEGIIAAMEKAGKDAPVVVVSVCGTDEDPQNLSATAERLAKAGAIVAPSNISAVHIALELMK